jgi:hypothetical protein
MSEWLSAFLAKPALPLEDAMQTADWPLCFVIDHIRQPRVLPELSGLADTLLIEPLFRDTEFVDLLEHSPLWVVTKPGSDAARLAARLCVDQRSGIALCVDDAEAGLRQARHLLKIKDAGGFSLARYYDPAVWAGCALASGEQAAALYGSWHAVYSPAAQGRGEEDLWLRWSNPGSDSTAALAAPLDICEAMLDASETLRWCYWVYQHSGQFNNPDNHQLPRLIGNLRYLAEHGLQETRHLLQLAELAGGSTLSERAQVVSILAKPLPAHGIVAELQTLSAG